MFRGPSQAQFPTRNKSCRDVPEYEPESVDAGCWDCRAVPWAAPEAIERPVSFGPSLIMSGLGLLSERARTLTLKRCYLDVSGAKKPKS